MKDLFIISFLVLIIVSCQHPTTLTEDNKKQIVSDVKQTLDNYYSDISKEGLIAEFKYLDSSSNFFWVPPGYTSAISYDSVSTILRNNASNYTSVVNSFETLQIIPLTNELATYTGRLKSIITDTSNTTSQFLMMETGIVIKRTDGWKLLSGQTSMLTNK